jgi:hypothetical protein
MGAVGTEQEVEGIKGERDGDGEEEKGCWAWKREGGIRL